MVIDVITEWNLFSFLFLQFLGNAMEFSGDFWIVFRRISLTFYNKISTNQSSPLRLLGKVNQIIEVWMRKINNQNSNDELHLI